MRNDVRDSGPRAAPVVLQADAVSLITDCIVAGFRPVICGNCGHWNAFVNERGECRRYAPSGAAEQPWPVTPQTAWCGDFTPTRQVHQ